jgi:hypothetical protein
MAPRERSRSVKSSAHNSLADVMAGPVTRPAPRLNYVASLRRLARSYRLPSGVRKWIHSHRLSRPVAPIHGRRPGPPHDSTLAARYHRLAVRACALPPERGSTKVRCRLVVRRSVGAIEVSRHSIEQVLRRHGGLALASARQAASHRARLANNGDPHSGVRRRAAAAPPRPAAGPPNRSPNRLRAECRGQPGADRVHVDSDGA